MIAIAGRLNITRVEFSPKRCSVWRAVAMLPAMAAISAVVVALVEIRARAQMSK